MNLTGHGIGSIYLTILLALLLSILPMPALLDTYRPDWVALSSYRLALESGIITTELICRDCRH